MQSSTTEKEFLCSIKFLHGSLKIVSAKLKVVLNFDAMYIKSILYGFYVCFVTFIHHILILNIKSA